MISFKLTHNSLRPETEMIEVFNNDRFVAAIYTDPDIPALKIVSRFLDGVVVDRDPPQMTPAILIPFKA